MRGEAIQKAMMLTAIPSRLWRLQSHPARRNKPSVDAAATQLSHTFDRMNAASGRAPMLPKHSLKSRLLMASFTAPSERAF